MKTTEFGEPIFFSEDLIREIYLGNFDKINLSKVDPDDLDYQKYVNFIDKNDLDWPIPEPFIATDISMREFDIQNQQRWFIPEEYKELDVAGYLYSLCETQEEKDRVLEELQLFLEHNMIDILRFLKYLVDKMRENNILWGVGRGSSVSSYCLYLLGIHKINSLKYDLDIKEFLR